MFFKLKSVVGVALALNAILPVCAHEQHHEARDKKGAVASESSVCSKIGIDLLKKGGNAADALVGTVLCIGVVGMYHSG